MSAWGIEAALGSRSAVRIKFEREVVVPTMLQWSGFAPPAPAFGTPCLQSQIPRRDRACTFPAIATGPFQGAAERHRTYWR